MASAFFSAQGVFLACVLLELFISSASSGDAPEPSLLVVSQAEHKHCLPGQSSTTDPKAGRCIIDENLRGQSLAALPPWAGRPTFETQMPSFAVRFILSPRCLDFSQVAQRPVQQRGRLQVVNLTSNDIKNGTTLLIDGVPYKVVGEQA